MGRKLENLVGQRFGELVVIELHKTETGRPTLWKCLCDCKHEHLFHGSMVTVCGDCGECIG